MWKIFSNQSGNRISFKAARTKGCNLCLEELEPRLLLSLPRPDHVVLVIEENHSFSEIMGSPSAPYINSLAQQGALMTNSYAITHPSQPNYLDLFSGANQGVTNDTCPAPGAPYSAANLASELIASSFTFGGYSEDQPFTGYTGCFHNNYVRKHNPWVNFTNVPSTDNLPFSGYFPSNFTQLPTVSIVVPNVIDDMHDGTIQQGDTWLKNNIDTYAQWAKTNNSLLVVTWDEDDGSQGNQIATIFVGQIVNPDEYNELINHFNVLRTIEDMYGLSYAGASSTATPITDSFLPAAPSNLKATVVSISQVNLKWTNNSNNETGFLIERSMDGTSFAQIASVGVGVTSYKDTGLAANTTYYYRVRGYNGVGDSTYSMVITTATSAPAAPSNLTAAVVSSSQVNLNWSDNSNNRWEFKIERSTDDITFTQIAAVGPNNTFYHNTGLTNPTLYYYRVRASNGVGNSAYSNVASVTTVGPFYVSTTGSDSNSGTSPMSSLRNIQTALDRATPGMTIYVAGGAYYEHLVTQVSGSFGEVITLTSYNGTVVIDGSTQPWTPGGDQNLGVIELRNPYYTLRKLEVINSKDTGIVLGADHLTVTGCTVAKTDRHAVSTDTGYQTATGLGFMIHDITITNNLIYYAVLLGLGNGQAVSLIADGFEVSGNTVRKNVTEGIDIWLGAEHGEVAHNVVYGNGAAGIYVDGAAYVRIDDNRVYSNSRGIGVSSENPNYSTHDIWVYNNLSYNNTGSGIFLWDSPTNPGFHGSQNVLIANNTLVNNNTSIDLQGDSNTAEIMNNLDYTTGSAISDTSTNSTYNIHNNVWLSAVIGFVSPSTGDFELTASSPAIDQGAQIPLLSDDLGNIFAISTDFLGLNRDINGVDAGAYEYQ